MLEIYLPVCNLPVCVENDLWFDAHVSEIEQRNTELKNIIACIDNVEYVGNNMIIAKYTGKQQLRLSDGRLAVATLPLSKLSTGCKTLINVTTYPDMLFSTAECGFNVFSEIVKLRQGRVLLLENIAVNKFMNDIRVVHPNGSRVIHDRDELEDLLDNYFTN